MTGKDPAPMDYQIDHDPIERGHLVVATGELDISATPRLSTVLAMASASPGGRLVLDLSDVAFIDSTALGTILKAAAQLDEAGTNLEVVAPEGPVRRLLEMTNLTQRFRLFGTRAAAHKPPARRDGLRLTRPLCSFAPAPLCFRIERKGQAHSPEDEDVSSGDT